MRATILLVAATYMRIRATLFQIPTLPVRQDVLAQGYFGFVLGLWAVVVDVSLRASIYSICVRARALILHYDIN